MEKLSIRYGYNLREICGKFESNFVKFRNVKISIKNSVIYDRKTSGLAEMHNKKIVVRIITFRVDKFSGSDIIKTVPAR